MNTERRKQPKRWKIEDTLFTESIYSDSNVYGEPLALRTSE